MASMFSLTSAISPVRRSTGHRTSSALVVIDILRIKDGLFRGALGRNRARRDQGGIQEQASYGW
jgi:hypothetical protein